MWLAVLVTVAVLYLLLHKLAVRSLFYPMQYPRGEWEAGAAAGARDVFLTTDDGLRLHAWWLEGPSGGPVTLFLHGNAGNVTHRLEHARRIVEAGSSILLLDYRGYGRSQGSPSVGGLAKDAKAAYEFLLQKGYDGGRIVAHGESLGTAYAVALAAEHKVGGVILEAPFSSARDVAARVLPVLGPLLIWGLDSERMIGRVSAPLLILHGDADEVIPFDLGQKLFAAAREPKQFHRIPGGGHNDIVESLGPEYVKLLRGLYQKMPGAT